MMIIMPFKPREKAHVGQSHQDDAKGQDAPQAKPGLTTLERLLARPSPDAVASLISSHPAEQSEIVGMCHQRFGNAFVAQIFNQRASDPEKSGDADKTPAPEQSKAGAGPAVDIDVGAAAKELVAGGMRDENPLTNEVFWRKFPAIRGVKLAAGTPEAAEWIRIRNQVVRPALDAVEPTAEAVAHKPSKPPKAAVAEEQHAPPPSEHLAKAEKPPSEITIQLPTPAPAPAPKAAESAAQAPAPAPAPATAAPATAAPAIQSAATEKADAPGGDVYLKQGDNSYHDKGQTKDKSVTFDRGWSGHNGKKGTAGGNTCNMTSLSMALCSIAGSEDAARESVIKKLRDRGGCHFGATAHLGGAGGKAVDLNKAIWDDELCAQIQLEDLVTALTVGKRGTYENVTSHGQIQLAAEATGLTKDAHSIDDNLETAKGRAKVAARLAKGDRVIAGTHNHIIYLVEVTDSGIVVHDPAGMRLPPKASVNFEKAGTLKERGEHWLAKMRNAKTRELMLRRSSTNSAVHEVLNKLAAIAQLPKKEQDPALDELIQAHPETLDLGAFNFYDAHDIKEMGAHAIMALDAPVQSPG